MSKLIFLDVDGTLVDYHNRIPESAVKAIRQARERGIWSMFVLAVARQKCNLNYGKLAWMG